MSYLDRTDHRPELVTPQWYRSSTGDCVLTFLTLYTTDFQCSTESCHLQKFSDDLAVVGCVREGEEGEYRTLVVNFVEWTEQNHLRLNVNKTREMVIDFWRKRMPSQPLWIRGRWWRKWRTTNTWEWWLATDWTRNLTLRLCTRGGWANSIFWRSWDPSTCAAGCWRSFTSLLLPVPLLCGCVLGHQHQSQQH